MPSNPSDLRATGDAMQSALSRLAEYIYGETNVEGRARTDKPPYEVQMAALEGKSAVDQWTELRRRDAVQAEAEVPVDLLRNAQDQHTAYLRVKGERDCGNCGHGAHSNILGCQESSRYPSQRAQGKLCGCKTWTPAPPPFQCPYGYEADQCCGDPHYECLK